MLISRVLLAMAAYNAASTADSSTQIALTCMRTRQREQVFELAQATELTAVSGSEVQTLWTAQRGGHDWR